MKRRSAFLTLPLWLAAAVLLTAQTPRLVIEEDCPAFVFTPDGTRLIYAVQRIYSERNLYLQRDDLWETTLDGHRHRLVDGKKLVRSPVPFSYAIRRLRLSPSGRRMTVAMDTRAMTGPGDRVRAGQLVDLMDSDGKEIEIAGTHNSVIEHTLDAVWLADDETVVYRQPADPSSLLFRLAFVRPRSGRSGIVAPDQAFVEIAWDAPRNRAVAVARDAQLAGPIRLLLVDLVRQTVRPLAQLPQFAGGLSVSPDGAWVGYFLDGETLEVRSLAEPERVRRVHVPFGPYHWFPDGRRLLLKRGLSERSGQLLRVELDTGTFAPVLGGLLFFDGRISPDGRWVAVTEPGKRILKIFPVQDLVSPTAH